MSVIGYKENIKIFKNLDDIFLKLKVINNYSQEQANNLKFEPLSIGEDKFYLIKEDKKNLLEETELNTHQVIKFDEEFKQDIQESLEYLKNNFENYYKVIKENVKYIINLSLKEDKTNIDSTITSCSLPNLPYVIFISHKAKYHIPPSNISENKNKLLLAENIYHEAIHQIVNLHILKKEVLLPHYSSKTSPKIEIPWRKHQKEERNKQWELDRVLHATSVYANLLPFRKSMIEKIENTNFKKFYLNSIESGKTSFEHLLNSIYEKKDYFGKDGIKIIDKIKKNYN